MNLFYISCCRFFQVIELKQASLQPREEKILEILSNGKSLLLTVFLSVLTIKTLIIDKGTKNSKNLNLTKNLNI